jgi:ATP-dependent DNA helicase PIF1
LRNLSIEEFTFIAEVSGLFDPKQFPTESALRLKLGAQVMFIKNDIAKKEYVNGTIGKIIKLNNDSITVQIEERDGTLKNIDVEKQTWEILRYKLGSDPSKIDTEVIGSFKQYPLRLAWAITIHKSQGKTFDKVIIDLTGGAFEHGQTYVALSRCRTLEGIVLKQPVRPQDIRVDERIVEFYEKNF